MSRELWSHVMLLVASHVLVLAAVTASAFEWEKAAPESQGFSSPKLKALRADLEARGTKALLVIRNDRIVCEWYAPGHAADKTHGTASLAKAIVGGLSLAVALSDGRLALDDPAAKFIPQWRDDPRKSRITLRQLGSHTSGIEDAEADGQPHEQLTGWKGEFWKRLAVPNDPFTISRDRAPLVFEPGEKMQYSNPGIALLTYCVTAALRDAPQKDIRSLLSERVMRLLGVPDTEWSLGYGKTYTVDGLPLVGSWGGGSYTARAVARVGRLMLHGGQWDEQRLLSAAAVRLTTSDAGTPGPCGIGWWSNHEGDCAKLPRDAFFGSGAGHQILLVVPSLDLIVVRNGNVLAKAEPTPKSYHDAYRQFLFEPLMDALVAENVSQSQADSAPQTGVRSNGFSVGRDTALHFGVHEVVLTNNGSAINPFDTVATVTFTPPSGEAHAKTVHAFHDGGNTWRTRVYVSETGEWSWTSACQTDQALDGQRGTFQARTSNLRGRLLIHPKNPRQWITEDGRWFLNLNDTAYFLLCSHDGKGEPVPWEDFTAYVRDAVAHGITSFRSFGVNGPKKFVDGNSDRHRWYDLFADESLTRLNLEHLQTADRRLRWLLDNYPDVYVQFILFPLGTPWRTDESFWAKLDSSQKERVMRHLIARFAAYPSIFWLIVNDAHYAPDKLSSTNRDVAGALQAAKFPNNIALAREVGAYFQKHDPWQHPLSTGHARTVPFQFGAEDWATYIHLEDQYDLGARAYDPCHQFAKPVFLGEDRYEQDRPDRDPTDMRYYQRRLFWAWLLSGGSANYGGRWWAVQPYTQTGKREAPSPWHKGVMHTEQLVGLDSVRLIRGYFADRQVELNNFEPAHGLAKDLDGADGPASPRVMRRGQEEFLVYHPNAASNAKDARPVAGRAARLSLNLAGALGAFSTEWFRAADGASHSGAPVSGGAEVLFSSPWPGQDVVLRLTRKSGDPPNQKFP